MLFITGYILGKHNMSNIAIIPARGGSKRIHKKNIKLFLDKPIMAYAIQNAINSKIFDTVMVSTDDYEIADIAKSYCADVPFMRSEKNSSDYATTKDVILEVINEYQNQYNKFFNYFCCIYPCTPLLTTQDIISAMKITIDNHYETTFPVVPYPSPIYRSIIIENDIPKRLYPQFENTRTQDLQQTYYDAGQYYCGNTKLFLNNTNTGLLTQNTRCIITSPLKYHDIDNEEDWKLAEIKYIKMNQL